jgi:hypothetical protein
MCARCFRSSVHQTDISARAFGWRTALVVLFLAAFTIRLYHINDPLLEFHVARQYRSAVIARGLYLPYNTSMPEWAREIAALNAEQGTLEPPIVETLAVYAYRLLDGERLWVGRAISIAGWLLGGIALFLISCRMSSSMGTLVALSVFLLAPFGVLASRSFQPDALMIGFTTVAILQIIRFAESPKSRRLCAAILAHSRRCVDQTDVSFFYAW